MNAQINLYSEIKTKINDGMIGLFFEDINYAGDGGLYAEYIENRNFEFYKAFGGIKNGDWYTQHEGLYAWNPFGAAEIKVVSASPVAAENPHYLRMAATGAGGFSNKAYDGILLTKGHRYNVSFYARNVSNLKLLSVTVKDSSGKISASAEVELFRNEENTLCPWKKYELTLEALTDLRGGLFCIESKEACTVEFDFISMIPCDAVCGIFRKDLFEKLDELHPGFIRFPGGCIIEGATLENRYNFKETLKPLIHRKHNWSRWAVHTPMTDIPGYNGPDRYPFYNQTYGIGFYEYFLLCEKLNCKPLPVLNVGLACQYQSYETVALDSPEFQQYLQDAVDLISFANDDPSTKWGSVRAALGHPQPFNLEMVGIGNEQWDTPQSEFFKRYLMFEKTIHESYPSIRLIGSAGPNVISQDYKNSWDFIRAYSKTNAAFAYAVDEHYYVKPQWLFDNNEFYDDYDRSVKVFAGEYAAHPEGSGSFNNPAVNTLEGALAEAAFLTGIERNADAVILASYAPLFARMGYTQWSPDMIWFNDKESYATPSWYVQKAFSNYTGDCTLDTRSEHKALREQKIYYNPSFDTKTGTVYLKIVNANDQAVSLDLCNKGEFNFTSMQVLVMGGTEKETSNSFEKPDAVQLLQSDEKSFDGKVELPRYSFAVVVLK
ncbi:MAG: carbohydrate binding domain-containing protein [Treponema sp.]|nr:carbohydrate binding domain-containing protein [Treponema sp.]